MEEGVGSTETRDKGVKTSEESVDSTREEAVQQTPCGEGDGENASTRDPQKGGGAPLSVSHPRKSFWLCGELEEEEVDRPARPKYVTLIDPFQRGGEPGFVHRYWRGGRDPNAEPELHRH